MFHRPSTPGRLALAFALALLVGFVPTIPSFAEGFDVHDLVTMTRLSAPTPSPDGAWIAYVVRETDLDADRGRTDIHLIRPDGSDHRQLTTHEASDGSPVWSPDGRHLYFLSSRSDSSQVWRFDLGEGGGGEPVQVTDLPVSVGNLVLSPDGSKLAFSADVFSDCDTLACTAERMEAQEASPETGRLYDRLFVRQWDTWGDGTRSTIFVLPATTDGSEGTPVAVTAGLGANVPGRPFGGAEEIAWTPDSSGLVVTARKNDAGEPWSTDFDLYHVRADGSGEPRLLTGDNDAWDTGPVFSPDGGTLAYLAMERPGFEADRWRVMLRPWSADGPAGDPKELAPDWDRSPGGVVFSPDGGTLYATAADVGQVSLFALDVESGEVTRLVGEGHVRSPAVLGDGSRLVFGRDTLTSPVDLFTVAADGSGLARITEANRQRLAGVEMGEFEQFSFAGWNGETVHGYVVKPAGFSEGETYPVAFLIHGGPQGSFGNGFHYRWNPQTYAGAGYAAVMIDFHGSTGYGQAFTDSISQDWGGKPLEDLQKGLAAALERYPFLDGDRVCALGASYGGYMINWIAGQWPERFRCLVNHDGVFDTRSMYFTTEELWFPEWEMGGPYWESPEIHERHNPARFVDRWRTPMLVIQGALDYRVPEGQGIAAFTALQRRGVPSRFLHFPDENHWVLKPANSILWHDTVLAWMERWLGDDAAAEAAEAEEGR